MEEAKLTNFDKFRNAGSFRIRKLCFDDMTEFFVSFRICSTISVDPSHNRISRGSRAKGMEITEYDGN